MNFNKYKKVLVICMVFLSVLSFFATAHAEDTITWVTKASMSQIR